MAPYFDLIWPSISRLCFLSIFEVKLGHRVRVMIKNLQLTFCRRKAVRHQPSKGASKRRAYHRFWTKHRRGWMWTPAARHQTWQPLESRLFRFAHRQTSTRTHTHPNTHYTDTYTHKGRGGGGGGGRESHQVNFHKWQRESQTPARQWKSI